MFTGIVEELGTVAAVEDQGDADPAARPRRAPSLDDVHLGDSISVNGVLPDRGREPPTATAVHRRRDAGDARRASLGDVGPATGSTSSAR